jgi:hypothetical protein
LSGKVGKTNNFVVGLGKTAWTSVSDPANNVPTSPHVNPFWNLEPMPRWRYSLRTFLLVVVAATAITSLGANHLLRCRRVRQSQEWLLSQGVGCHICRNDRLPFFWELPSYVYVNMLYANDDPFTPIYWQHINQMGPLTHLRVSCQDVHSREFQHCVHTHRDTLETIYLRCKHLSLETGLALSECQRLEELVIVADSVESTFQLQPLPKLKSVSITTEMSPELVSTIGRCPTLRVLDLGSSSIDERNVRKLIAIPTLRTIRIPPVFLSSGVVDEILASSLDDVNIASSRIATTDLRRLMACERLQRITIRLGMLDGPWLPVNRSSPLRVAVEADDQLTTDRICQIVTRCLKPDSGMVTFDLGYGVPRYELFECEAGQEIGPGMMDDPPWLNSP